MMTILEMMESMFQEQKKEEQQKEEIIAQFLKRHPALSRKDAEGYFRAAVANKAAFEF